MEATPHSQMKEWIIFKRFVKNSLIGFASTSLVNTDNIQRLEELPEPLRPRDAQVADVADLVGRVGHVAISLRGAVELGDLLDAEPIHELLPDVLSQSVAEHQLHIVLWCNINRLEQGLEDGEKTSKCHDMRCLEHNQFTNLKSPSYLRPY